MTITLQRINKNFLLTLFISFVLFLSACSHQPDSLSNAPLKASTTNSNDQALVHVTLKRFYQDYQGTPYQYGGLSKRGLDCSGVVYKTYREYLGWQVPRSTELQLSAGNAIKAQSLKSGDLVFYRPNNKGMHVGIYYDNANGGRFLHASSSKGVIISNMKNSYWTPYFYQARRIR